MDFTVQKAVLLNGIQIVQNGITQKSSLPILSNVLLEVSEDKLKLITTDLDIGICATIPVSVTQKGTITAPANKFFEIIKALPDEGEINISLKKNNSITVKSGKVQFKIIGLPVDDFPQLPLFKGKDLITLDQKEFKNILNLIDFAISKDNTRYILNGVLFTIKEDKIDIVATDGRRLAVANKKLSTKTSLEKNVVIPMKTVQEVKRLLGDKEDIKIQFGDNQIKFSFADSFIISRLIEGEFPDYKKVIPTKSKTEVKIKKEEFLDATRRASIFTDQESQAIKLNIQKKCMIISKNTPNLGESKEQIDIDYSGDDTIEIGFNPIYLIDILKNLTQEEIIFEISDSTKSGVIRLGNKYIYVVLPMQLNS